MSLFLPEGFTHSEAYKLFELGETSSEAVKAFAETGDTEALDKQKPEKESSSSGDDDGPILDGFSAAPIEQGTGRSQAKLFVDGNHTLVSTVTCTCMNEWPALTFAFNSC